MSLFDGSFCPEIPSPRQTAILPPPTKAFQGAMYTKSLGHRSVSTAGFRLKRVKDLALICISQGTHGRHRRHMYQKAHQSRGRWCTRTPVNGTGIGLEDLAGVSFRLKGVARTKGSKGLRPRRLVQLLPTAVAAAATTCTITTAIATGCALQESMGWLQFGFCTALRFLCSLGSRSIHGGTCAL